MIKNKTRMSTFSTSIYIILGVLAFAVRQEKEIQSNQTGKEVEKCLYSQITQPFM